MKLERRHMRVLRTALLSVAFATASLTVLSETATAGSVTEPGETVGLALGAPLPEGIYFVNTASYISRGTSPTTNAIVNIPVFAWSTPWTILGGRVEAYTALPMTAVGVVGVNDGTWQAGFYNDALLVGAAWDLGHGFGFSNFVGGYAPMKAQGLAVNVWTFNYRAALSYTANHWNLTAHLIYGTSSNDRDTGANIQPDYLNYDLTATKTFGKWEVGPVAYGSADLTKPHANYFAQGQFALGLLGGYNFGPLSVQLYVTHDLYQDGYGGTDTRGFLRFVVPLWSPKA